MGSMIFASAMYACEKAGMHEEALRIFSQLWHHSKGKDKQAAITNMFAANLAMQAHVLRGEVSAWFVGG